MFRVVKGQGKLRRRKLEKNNQPCGNPPSSVSVAGASKHTDVVQW